VQNANDFELLRFRAVENQMIRKTRNPPDTGVQNFRVANLTDSSQFRHLTQPLEGCFGLIEKPHGRFETLIGEIIGDFHNVLSGSRRDNDGNTHGNFP